MQRRALIVDDEASTCEMIQRVLYAAGIDALALTQSAQAHGFLEEGKFDMLFFDLHMSSPDGIELARDARGSSANRSTPIVMLSDDQRPSALAEGFAAGASFFLYKPIDKGRLLRLVRATQQQTGVERRQTRRVQLHSKILLRCGSEEVTCDVVDVSLNGVLVRAPRVFPVGSPVHISMGLARQTRHLIGGGCVARIAAPNQMGIALNQLPVEESERLQEFLLPLLPRD
jgi:DNA-binding response OmpR family regulator